MRTMALTVIFGWVNAEGIDLWTWLYRQHAATQLLQVTDEPREPGGKVFPGRDRLPHSTTRPRCYRRGFILTWRAALARRAAVALSPRHRRRLALRGAAESVNLDEALSRGSY